MNIHHLNPVKARLAALDSRLIDERILAHTHARLLSRLEAGESATWQETFEAPLEAVWDAAAASAAVFLGHLPDVNNVHVIGSASRERKRYGIERDIAGTTSLRISEVLIDVPRSMFCASDLDSSDISIPGPLPTMYAMTIHDHPSRPAATVLVLSGTTLGTYNPWILPALSHQCQSIRRALETAHMPHIRGSHGIPERYNDRVAVAGAARR